MKKNKRINYRKKCKRLREINSLQREIIVIYASKEKSYQQFFEDIQSDLKLEPLPRYEAYPLTLKNFGRDLLYRLQTGQLIFYRTDRIADNNRFYAELAQQGNKQERVIM